MGVVIGTLMLALLLAALDQTIVSTALPTIVSDLGGLNHLSWVVTAYLLATTASTPLWGKLGDQYGRKALFQSAIVIFLVGSALCGLAQDMGQLIAFRALQGLGGGGLITLTQAIVGDVVPPRERGRYQGLFGGVFGGSSVLGPLLGGFFVDELSWRWVFTINLPIGAVALLVISVVLRPTTVRVRHRIDYLGIVLLAAAVTCVVLLTSWGGSTYPWVSPQTIALGAGALVLGTAWWFSARRAAEPVMPLRLFRDPVFRVAAAISFAIGFAMLGSLTFLPLFLQVVHGVSPTMSGVHLLPMVVGMLGASVLSGQVVSRTGRYKVFPILGTACTGVALFLLSHLDENTSTAVMSGYFLVLGIGLGLVMQVLVVVVQNSADYADLGVATSGATFFRSIGSSFGVAVFGTVFSNGLAANIRSATAGHPLPPGFDPSAVQSDASALDALPPDVQAGLLHAYALSIDKVFLSAIPPVAVAFVLALLLKEVPLRRTRDSGDLGSGLAPTPTVRSSIEIIEREVVIFLGREGRLAMYARLARSAGLELSAQSCWLLTRLARLGPVAAADLAGVCGPWAEDARPTAAALAAAGFVRLDEAGGRVELTDIGERTAQRVFDAGRDALVAALAEWQPERHPDLYQVLTEIARELLGDEADARLLAAAHGPDG
nr:MDR family MFS transporter [Allonocardiopsis opalescens]